MIEAVKISYAKAAFHYGSEKYIEQKGEAKAEEEQNDLGRIRIFVPNEDSRMVMSFAIPTSLPTDTNLLHNSTF